MDGAGWQAQWERLLKLLKPSLQQQRVVVLADRGLYAKPLVETIVDCGWPPLLRINAQGRLILQAGQVWELANVAARLKGKWWRGRVTCFTGKSRLSCTLLAMWDEQQREAWLLLTSRPPDEGSPTWYAVRWGIECNVKLLKSDLFHGERTRMTAPHRAERFWLVLAVASLRLATLAMVEPPPNSKTPPRLSQLRRAAFTQLAARLAQCALQRRSLLAPRIPPTPALDFLTLLKTYP